MIKEYKELLEKEKILNNEWWNTTSRLEEEEIEKAQDTIRDIKSLYPNYIGLYLSDLNYFNTIKEARSDLRNIEYLLNMCIRFDINIDKEIKTKNCNFKELTDEITKKIDEKDTKIIKPWNLTIMEDIC